MNYQPRRFRSNMTSKCQVTIPKEIRDALGLKGGDVVSFTLDDDGNARISPADQNEQLARHKERIVQGLAEARMAFKANNTLPKGMTSDEWCQMMRGPSAEA
jgi:AbrB family looped-hinge helix DNA binding protein